MYSKKKSLATAAVLTLFAACSSVPWKHQAIGNEVNLSATFRNNLIFLRSVSLNGESGRFLLGSATPVSVIDPSWLKRLRTEAPFTLQLGQKATVSIAPALLDLEGAGDMIIGADAWNRGAVSIDYHSGLVTYQKEGIHPELMMLFPFRERPEITIMVDGKTMPAVVDTSSPDTLLLPRQSAGRGKAAVTIAGTSFGMVDVGYDKVTTAHVGNRLLSRFLVTIDYGRHEVGLFRDSRTAL